MAFNKVRYVTVCQQFLTTAVVLATGLTAAGVLTLEIQAPDQSVQAQRTPQQEHGRAGDVKAQAQTPVTRRAPAAESPVNVRPVQPKVREVAVATVPQAETKPAPRAQAERRTPAPTAEPSPTTDPEVREGVAKDRTIVAVSEPEKVTGYATVGVTWKSGSPVEEDDLRVEVRTQENGQWSDWSEAEFHDDHGPDAPETNGGRVERPGTDALVVGDVDEVQMRATSVSGQAPEDVNLAIIDPGVGKQTEEAPDIDTAALASAGTEDESQTETEPLPTSEGPLDLSATLKAPKPYIYSRAQWGANEKMRDGSPRYGSIKTGFVHHTVNANNYSASQVPALIRGIYAYHTQSRGWSDIGYNFLVDRFGRIWEGRYGGVSRAVIGAHTLGYNEYSFAMSAIGNFDVTQPPAVMLDAYAKLFAWKLSLAGIPADRTGIKVKTKTFRAINGHRDAGSTACPGRYLYAKLPTIRTKARAIQAAGTPTTPPTPPAPTYDPAQTPGPAVEQPSSLTFPKAFNLVGSGAPDIVAALGTTIRIFEGTGKAPEMGSTRSLGATWDNLATRAVVGDLTKDGRTEMIVRARTGVAYIYSLNSSGQLVRIPGTATRAFALYSQIAGVGDVTGDGKPDVVARNGRTKALMLFRGYGNGKFAAPTLVSKTLVANSNAMWAYGNIVGNSRADLIFRESSGALYVAPGIRGGGFGPKTRLPVVPDASFAGVSDLDIDGKRDLVFSKGPELYARTGNGTSFAGKIVGPFPVPTGFRLKTMVHVGGSGQGDLVGVNSAGVPIAALHNGQKGFGRAFMAAKDIQAPSSVMSVGDWNGDGKNDVITRQGAGGTTTLIIRPGKGNGTLGNGSRMPGNWSRVTQIAALGDVTGDGKPDLVGRVGNTAVRVWPGDGKKGFLKPQLASRYLKTFGLLGSGTWRTFEMPNTAISNRDGIFVPVAGPGTTTTTRARLVEPGSDVVFGVGDLNGDGKADLIAREPGTGALWLLRGNGLATGGVSGQTFLGKGFGGFSALG